MKTLLMVEITPIFLEGEDFIPSYKEIKEREVWISEYWGCAVHRCLCGCGEKTVLPLNNTGWQLIKESGNRVSFTPSIGNYQIPCKSHYIITNNIANFV